MSNYSIKKISLFGFIILFIMFIFSGITIYFFVKKYEELNERYNTIEKSYHKMLDYKYFTERLLTTQNLKNETKLWQKSKKSFENTINSLINKGYELNETIINFYKVIEKESYVINKKLANPLFSEENIMEKSILRRLGEGLNSNESSDYYLVLTDLKNSIDYLKQYEEFLLDDLETLSQTNSKYLHKQIKQMKQFGFITFIGIILLGFFVIRITLKSINKTEIKLLNTKNRLFKMNKKLKIQQNELETIINNIPSMVFAKDVNELKFLTLNKIGEEILGISSKDILGKNDYDLFPKEQAKFFIEKDKEVILKDEIANINEEKISTPNGEKILSTKKVLVKDEKNNPLFLLAISDDITQKVKQEKILEEQSRNAAMGEMIGNIAHQWRQPLSVISSGVTGILVQQEIGVLDEKQLKNTCKLINENAQYLSKTIDDFKNFIKNERKLVNFNLSEIINTLLNLVQPSIKKYDLKLILDFNDSINIEGYPNELTQCLMNIFNNSKDILVDSNLEEKLIFINTFKKANSFIIEIKDNAGGIPTDVLPKIFDPYFTTKHKKHGTGLGLSMTYKLITEGMNGSIVAENVKFIHNKNEYIGAKFTIVLYN